MKLIAESGSTRTEWSLVEGKQIIQNAFSEGINPFFQNRREISRSIRLGLPEVFFRTKLDVVYYYGTGCNSDEKKNMLNASLVAQFKTPINVDSNLLGAARGLFINEPGIACILGTGSNSCFYDGNKIVKNVSAGGYILGDEGGGAVLGKLFLADLLKGLTPTELASDFFDTYRITPHEAMDYVYNRPSPNLFLGTIAYFLGDHLHEEYVRNLWLNNLRNFFNRCICQYNYKEYPVRVIGSITFSHQDILKEVAKEFDVLIDRIEETSMKGLIDFHSTNFN